MKLLQVTSALLLASVAAAQSTPKVLATTDAVAVVHSIRALPEASGPIVEIISTRPLVPKIGKLESPARLVIDLPNARLGTQERRLDFRGSEINGIRLNQFQENPPVARIVVDLSKPVAYTWDAAGNRLMIRLHPAEEAAKLVATPAVTRAVLPSLGTSGAVMLAGSRIGTGSAVTAGADTAVLRLGRGGEILVCPGTTVSVTASQSGRALMLGMNSGAMEAHYSLDTEADSILTPDFRILLAGPGEFHFGVSADARGNTCIQSLPGNTASAIVAELLGDGTYQVKAAQQVMFHAGKLTAVDTTVAQNCGCPPTSPALMRAASTATVSDPRRPVTAALPASKPNDIHVQVEAPIVYRATDPQPAPVEQAKLLPMIESPAPVSFTAEALPPKPERHGFFGRLRGFFSAIFG